MESHQEALVDQAIRYALTRYDDQHSLLRASEDPRFRAVPESLRFAALLLARSASGQGRRTELGLARLLIDRVLPLQNTTRRDPLRGAFPIVWSPASDRPQILDPDSREVMGSLLGLLLKDYAELLGGKRADRVREAIVLTLRDKGQPLPEDTANAMTAAWLEIEFGDRLRGERLATEVTLAGHDHLVGRRFGDAKAFAGELWALSLWRRSSRLHDSVAPLLSSLMEDIHQYAHPALPEVFGAVTTSTTSSNAAYPWLGSWLTWLALGSQPLLPKTMTDPLHATCYAFPALAKLKMDELSEAAPLGGELSLSHTRDKRIITGWWEPALHIEARESPAPAPNRLPVAGARWRTPSGATVWMRTRVSRAESATCKKRFVHLRDPGTTLVSVHNMEPGETRMIDNGWWLAGLHFATEGYQMIDAERTERSLELKLKPTSEQALLMFSPLK